MIGLTNCKDAVCVKCGYEFNKVLSYIVEDSGDSHYIWILECTCGEAYEVEYNGSYDECTFLHLKTFTGGPRIMLKDLIENKSLNWSSKNGHLVKLL